MLKMNSKGQTLVEMIVVISVGVLVVGGLVFATISSLRNANFAKNQTQVTKLAQEGIERARSIRNQDGAVSFSHGSGLNAQTTSKFSDLYGIQMSLTCNPCNFTINSTKTGLTYNTPPETLGNFTRKVTITDDTNFATEKNVTVIVSWTDPTGPHESRLTTILTKK